LCTEKEIAICLEGCYTVRAGEGVFWQVIDPKGLLREPSSCLAGESCNESRESVKETFRVWDNTGARVAVRYGGGAGRAVTVRACPEPVERLEAEIDRLVYGLYGLMEEEIGIVEGR